MPAYFDSSVLLSLVLGDTHAERAHALWHAELERVSSILLDVECTTVLRRMPAKSWSDGARLVAEKRLRVALEEITIKPLDEDIANIVRDTPALAQCRTLDAAHVATALHFRAASGNELQFCTFDARMAEIAARLSFSVCTAISQP